jgi:hypothetical protein
MNRSLNSIVIEIRFTGLNCVEPEEEGASSSVLCHVNAPDVLMFCTSRTSRAVPQAVGRRFPIVAARVQARVNS